MAACGSSARHSGFTLVEVLVAMAVLAIALAAVMRVVTQSIDMTAGLRDRGIAMGVAQDRLTMHYLERDWPGLDTTSGTREQGGRVWHWQERVTSSPMPEIRQIEIEVRADPGGEPLVRLMGLLLEP